MAIRRRPDAEHASAFVDWTSARAKIGEPSPRKLDNNILNWSLEQYIEIARHIPLIGRGTADALTTLRGFRNLIHPARAERLQQKPSLGGALLATGAMRTLLDEVREGVAAGSI